MTRKWARAAALRGIRTSARRTNDNDAHVCEPICINMYCRAKHNNQGKKIPIHWRKESWQKFQSCKFIHGQYFCDNFILLCDVIRFTGMVIIVVRPPWVRCEFLAELPLVLICSHKQRCCSVLPELWYEVASNLNTFFPELEATNSNKSRWKCIAIHQNVSSKSLSQNCQGIF